MVKTPQGYFTQDLSGLWHYTFKGQLMHAVKIKKGYNAGKFALVCDHGDNKKTKLFHVLEGFKA